MGSKMENKPLVSIIVPSYNVEEYVRKCLDSIKAQTYKNWECIIVDRQSTKDKTTEVIKRYIKGDKRFHFIKQVNKGVSDGRNVGFMAAKGKYVQFTDPDDWLSPDLLRLSVKRAEEMNADIVQFAWKNYYVQSGESINTGFIPYAQKFPPIFSVKSLGEEIFKYGEIHINSMSKLWRREFLVQAQLHYPEDLKRAEDLAEVSRLVMLASRITYLDEILYYYKIDEYLGDTLSNFNSDDGHNLDFYRALKIVHNNMKKHKLLPKLKNQFCHIALNNSMHALHMSKFNMAANKEIYECIVSDVLPMVSDELRVIDPGKFELFSNNNYSQYLEKNIKKIYFENQERQNYTKKLETENAQMKNDLISLQNELKSHLSISRSAKLMLGNIKRQLLKNIKKLSTKN